MEQDNPSIPIQLQETDIDYDYDAAPPAQDVRFFDILLRLFGCKKNSGPGLQHRPRVTVCIRVSPLPFPRFHLSWFLDRLPLPWQRIPLEQAY